MAKAFSSSLIFVLKYNRSCYTNLITTRKLHIAMENQSKRIRQEIPVMPVIGTHSGTFHCDEVLACFMLRQLPEYKDATIFRSRKDQELQDKCDVILDVGGQYDHASKRYDHHQNSFKETLSTIRPDLGKDFNIRLSSAGLIYAHYGEHIIGSILKHHENTNLSPENLRICVIQIYKNFICEIDAIDNGVPMFEGGVEPLYKISTHISARIGKLNPSWEEEAVNSEDVDRRFEKAMAMAGQEFVSNVIFIGCSWIKAREYVRESLKQAKSVYKTGEILILKRFCPWHSHINELEKELDVEGTPKLVLFPDNDTWRVSGVPIQPGSFLGRKFLPKPWRGLRDEELSQVAGIPDLIFVHHSGFIGGAKSREAALKMAIASVEWQDEIQKESAN